LVKVNAARWIRIIAAGEGRALEHDLVVVRPHGQGRILDSMR
jgi:hypothetical protein